MKNFLKEFKDFIATGNLVEVAVAFILALAIKAVIDAFMNSIVNPLIGAIVGKPNLDNFLTFTVRKGTANQATISDRRGADSDHLADHRRPRAVPRLEGLQQDAQAGRGRTGGSDRGRVARSDPRRVAGAPLT